MARAKPLAGVPLIAQAPVQRAITAITNLVNQSSFRAGLYRAAGHMHLFLIKRAMSASGITGFGRWVELSPRRAKELGRPNSTLEDTGALKKSMKVVATANGWEISVGVDYGDIHQTGGTNEQGAFVPARPYLLMTDAWRDIIWNQTLMPFIRERTTRAVRKALAA